MSMSELKTRLPKPLAPQIFRGTVTGLVTALLLGIYALSWLPVLT